MRRKGVCYDVGRELEGRSWRPDFRPGEVRRELEIIAGDLHCTAVRICSADSLLRAPATQDSLNEFLARAAAAVRPHFGGQITYCALLTEHVDWTGYDVAGFDLYRDKLIRRRFGRAVQVFRNKAGGRPLVIGEFGCCTYQGAADRGGLGFDIIDHGGGQPHVDGDYVRDEAGQAREITECLDIFEAGGADIAFVHTFVQQASPWDATEHGTTYPDMPWEPKDSFRAVAAWNAAH
ncbi:MAG: hypothetical protein ACRDPY_31975 [Streptosporangiaceae bacterium]